MVWIAVLAGHEAEAKLRLLRACDEEPGLDAIDDVLQRICHLRPRILADGRRDSGVVPLAEESVLGDDGRLVAVTMITPGAAAVGVESEGGRRVGG